MYVLKLIKGPLYKNAIIRIIDYEDLTISDKQIMWVSKVLWFSSQYSRAK